MAHDPDAQAIDGRYEVGPVIGRGAMGEVRRGRDTRLDRSVAIKLLRQDLAADPEVRRRFEDEARSAARLNHPAIVAVYDSGEWDGLPYLVMECLPGRTLADEMADGQLAPERVRAIAVDVAGALDVAHRLGVVHRDVKPGNILLTESGGVKLGDFGIAKSAEALDHTQTGAVLGTPAYISPERLAGEPATPQSDIYALGVVLYEALTGERAFRGDTPLALAHAVYSTTPPPVAERLPGVDSALAQVVDAAMAKEPEQRPDSAGAMLAALSGAAPERATFSADTELMSLPDATTALAPTVPDEPAAPALEAGGPGSPTPRPRSRLLAGALVALGALVVVVALALATDGDGGTDEPTPTTAAPVASVPEPLDDALERLEESVRP